jgi:mono/diheme cytochrome c family protein
MSSAHVRPLGLLATAVAVAGVAALTLRDDPTHASPQVAAANAAEVFHAKGCAECHDGPGWDSPVGIGPSLRDAAAWAGTRIAGMSAEDYVRQSVVAPQAFMSPVASPGPFEMPTITVSAEELDALVAYVLQR